MKKLAPLFVLIILVGTFVPGQAQAQYGQLQGTQPTDYSTGQGASTGSGPPSTQPDDIGCSSVFGSTDPGKGAAICVSNFFYFIMVGVGAWVATICAFVFDYAVQITLTSASYALDFIAIGWGVVRDLANMSFLFILVYIAFKIMFQSETTGTIRMLTWVVVVALLVNFSFLLSRVAVDTGNIVAVQFYNAINAPLLSDTASSNLPTVPLTNAALATGAKAGQTKDLTAAIMTALNVQALTSPANFQQFVKNPNNSPMYLLIVLSVIYIMTGVALFIVAASFLFVGIKFIVRVIGLWFLIIGSPLAFIAAIFRGKEGGSKFFNMWLQYLLKFSAYPAVFMGMFWIQTIFMNTMASSSVFNGLVNAGAGAGTSQLAQFQAIATTAANVGVRLAFIVATLWMSLKVADWTVNEVGQVAGLARNGIGKIAGSLPVRLGGGALRFAGGAAVAPLRPAGRLIQAGVQSSTNEVERSGGLANRLLWRGVNRIAGNSNVSRTEVLRDAARKEGKRIVTRQVLEGRQTDQGREAEAAAAKAALQSGTLGAKVSGINNAQARAGQAAQAGQQNQQGQPQPQTQPRRTAAEAQTFFRDLSGFARRADGAEQPVIEVPPIQQARAQSTYQQQAAPAQPQPQPQPQPQQQAPAQPAPAQNAPPSPQERNNFYSGLAAHNQRLHEDNQGTTTIHDTSSATSRANNLAAQRTIQTAIEKARKETQSKASPHATGPIILGTDRTPHSSYTTEDRERAREIKNIAKEIKGEVLRLTHSGPQTTPSGGSLSKESVQQVAKAVQAAQVPPTQPTPPSPRTPSPAAPGAAKPPPQTPPEDYPYSEAAE